MAKPVRKRQGRKKIVHEEHLPLKRENFLVIGAGLLVIAAGYAAMLEGSVEGFLPLVVAPILLVLGYCVIIPIGIFVRKPFLRRSAPPATPEGTAASTPQ